MAASCACSDLVVLAAQHIRALLERVPGPKVLLLDHETTGFISVVLSQSEILQKEVFLVDRLDALPQGHFEHMSCVCFLRPTNENLLLLLQLLQQQQQQLPPHTAAAGGGGGFRTIEGQSNSRHAAFSSSSLHETAAATGDNRQQHEEQQRGGRFRDIHLFFSSSVQQQQPQMLRRLAKQDECEKIVQVQEFYVDIYALSPHVFSLNIPSLVPLQQQQLALWTAYEESLFQRMQDGVFSAILLSRTVPLIRFQSSSPVCKRLAAALVVRCAENCDLFEKRKTLHPSEGSADASAGGGGGGAAAAASGRRLVLLLVDRREDPVTPLLNQWTYRAMLHELIGIENNRVDLRKIAGVKPEQQDIVMSTLQDRFYRDHLDANFGDLGLAVQHYVRDYQQKTQATGQLESVEDMQRFVDAYPEIRKLSGNVSKHVSVIHALSRIVSERQLLDVSSLEQEIACREAKTEHFASILKALENPRINSLDKLRLVLLFALRYEGDSRLVELTSSLRAAGIEEEEVLLVRALLQYAGASQRDADLFSNKNFFAVARNSIQRGLKVIAFIVGGATYEEARDMEELSKQLGCSIILGGTTFLNSRSFLADVSQLIKGQTFTSVPIPL